MSEYVCASERDEKEHLDIHAQCRRADHYALVMSHSKKTLIAMKKLLASG